MHNFHSRILRQLRNTTQEVFERVAPYVKSFVGTMGIHLFNRVDIVCRLVLYLPVGESLLVCSSEAEHIVVLPFLVCFCLQV